MGCRLWFSLQQTNKYALRKASHFLNPKHVPSIDKPLEEFLMFTIAIFSEYIPFWVTLQYVSSFFNKCESTNFFQLQISILNQQNKNTQREQKGKFQSFKSIT